MSVTVHKNCKSCKEDLNQYLNKLKNTDLQNGSYTVFYNTSGQYNLQ